jgi:hypothetical protein
MLMFPAKILVKTDRKLQRSAIVRFFVSFRLYVLENIIKRSVQEYDDDEKMVRRIAVIKDLESAINGMCFP